MAVVFFNEDDGFSISGHLLSGVCRLACRIVDEEQVEKSSLQRFQSIEENGEINLHWMTDEEIETIAKALEELHRIVKHQSESVQNAYAGVHDLVSRVRQTKRGQT